MIYFDNAATTQMSEAALEALIYSSRECYGNPSSIYEYGKKSRNLIDESREIIARCIGAQPGEIYFTSGGTESDNWAIAQAKYQEIDSVITSEIEHHAIINPVQKLKDEGFNTIFVGVDRHGCLDKRQLKAALNGKKQLVSIMFQNNETGVFQPIREISELIHNSNLNSIFHTDAVQAVGHTTINVNDLGVDMLSASAHKFNGPKGVGFLFVREGIDISPLILGGGQEKLMRSGTENVAGIYAMAKALEENVNNLVNNTAKVKNLENRFLQFLDVENVKYSINGDRACKASGILNISFGDIDGEGLLYSLDSQDICVSNGSACNSKSKERSHVLLAMGLDEERIDSSIRISIGMQNTDDEIDTVANSIVKYIKLVRKIIK